MSRSDGIEDQREINRVEFWGLLLVYGLGTLVFPSGSRLNPSLG